MFFPILTRKVHIKANMSALCVQRGETVLLVSRGSCLCLKLSSESFSILLETQQSALCLHMCVPHTSGGRDVRGGWSKVAKENSNTTKQILGSASPLLSGRVVGQSIPKGVPAN